MQGGTPASTLPSLAHYEAWQGTCDTLHSHTQVLGKLAVELAPPEPQLQHTALLLTGRGWETPLLPAPDGSGAMTVALDLHAHETAIEHSSGVSTRIPLTPDRPVGELTRITLDAVRSLCGEVEIYPVPQEVPWKVPLDRDDEHATYDPEAVSKYFAAASWVALALARFRAPYRGRCSPVNAWWGSFDLAVNLYSGPPADPPAEGFIMKNAMDAEHFTIGWWPGNRSYGKPSFFAYAHPAREGVEGAELAGAGRWDRRIRAYMLDWDELGRSSDPLASVLEFGLAVFRHSSELLGWDPALGASLEGNPPPVR